MRYDEYWTVRYRTMEKWFEIDEARRGHQAHAHQDPYLQYP